MHYLSLKSPPALDAAGLQKFTSVLGAALVAGAGALVDADPVREAANLSALKHAQSDTARETEPQSLLSLFAPA